jgi:hypothetical protein
MPDVQEVFHMATQKVRPDPGALERQHQGQRRRVVKQKAAVYALVAVLVIGGGTLAISALRSGEKSSNTGATVTPTPIPRVTEGALEPGTYVIRTLDTGFDAAHEITIDVPDGYRGSGGYAVQKLGRDPQTGMAFWVIENVYADPCRWVGSPLDPPVGRRFDALVAALRGQKGFRTSTPTQVSVDGFTGTYMERTVPAGTNLAQCDSGEYRPWIERFVLPGQRDLLWILDVEGVPLVIDVPMAEGTSRADRAELIQMVESVRIDPR